MIFSVFKLMKLTILTPVCKACMNNSDISARNTGCLQSLASTPFNHWFKSAISSMHTECAMG
jgi:hypothetical protein